jgi:hypothetical protein
MELIRPAHTTTTRSLFDSVNDPEIEAMNRKYADSAEQQKEIVNYMEIDEYLT